VEFEEWVCQGTADTRIGRFRFGIVVVTDRIETGER
jgi:hypothetical protein